MKHWISWLGKVLVWLIYIKKKKVICVVFPTQFFLTNWLHPSQGNLNRKIDLFYCSLKPRWLWGAVSVPHATLEIHQEDLWLDCLMTQLSRSIYHYNWALCFKKVVQKLTIPFRAHFSTSWQLPLGDQMWYIAALRGNLKGQNSSIMLLPTRGTHCYD